MPLVTDFETILPKNRLSFTAAGPVLVVSFDNAVAAQRRAPNRRAWGHGFFLQEGHSVLGVMADDTDWFRCPALHASLLALRDQGFFQNFAQVVMTGTSMGGFGAAAFSSLAPGCRVISYTPQSTLHADLVPWETNHGKGRRQRWDGLFNDAAVESRQAAEVYLFYDPFHSEDRRHAARFTGENVRHLRSPLLGHGLPEAFDAMGLLKEVFRKASTGTLDNAWFYSEMRARKTLPKYHKEMLQALARHRHLKTGAAVARRAFETFADPFFAEREALFTAATGNILQAMNQVDRLARAQRLRNRARAETPERD
ncbi:conserved hypothetical protein [Roseovarius sp. EC-HK134]|uniref:hypothetical protein n=1 Tax=Roseovarius TaxID=74030 RepID=UPI00125B4041|nr:MULTISPECIES: hypothetical protein [unclassified Roseovarius]VVT29353.1 conserved hypothetical protein [Roseovarius sp. EC-HK134]VVT30529.1 conserved hypothetical protein [Roseovarius sp. EC-SD190]